MATYSNIYNDRSEEIIDTNNSQTQEQVDYNDSPFLPRQSGSKDIDINLTRMPEHILGSINKSIEPENINTGLEPIDDTISYQSLIPKILEVKEQVYKDTESTYIKPVSHVPRVEERLETNLPRVSSRVVDAIPYQGSIPTTVPNDYSITNYENKYAGGLVNPVKRETLKTTLILNSKFRENYVENHVHSQSDKIRMRTLYADNPNAFNRIKRTNTEKCEKGEYKTKICFDKYKTINTCSDQSDDCVNIQDDSIGNIQDDSIGTKGTSSDFDIELNEPFTNVVSMRLSGLEIMNGYYPISKYLGTDKFTIYYDTSNVIVSVDTSNVSVDLEEGTYTLEEIASEIHDQINEDLSGVTCEYNIHNGKLCINNNTVDISYDFLVDFSNPDFPERPLYYNLGWLLGFRNRKYCIPNTKTLCGDAAMNLIGSSYFLLEVNDFNNNHPQVISYNPGTNYSYNIRNILATIQNTTETNNIIFQDSSDRIHKARKYFGPVRIKKLHMRLLDEYGRPVDLNNGDFSINLEIETINAPHKNMTSR